MGHDILIVDDERDICTLIAGILEDEGHTARRAHNSNEAIEAVRQRRPSLVILDVWLQGSELDGLQIGSGRIGPITARIQEAFSAATSGSAGTHAEWRTAVPGFKQAVAGSAMG